MFRSFGLEGSTSDVLLLADILSPPTALTGGLHKVFGPFI